MMLTMHFGTTYSITLHNSAVCDTVLNDTEEIRNLKGLLATDMFRFFAS